MKSDRILSRTSERMGAMAFGDRIKARREELALSRPQLADRLGVTPSTVSNYETGVSFPKEEMMLRLFDCLETDPNTLFQDSFRRGADVLTDRCLLYTSRCV